MDLSDEVRRIVRAMTLVPALRKLIHSGTAGKQLSSGSRDGPVGGMIVM